MDNDNFQNSGSQPECSALEIPVLQHLAENPDWDSLRSRLVSRPVSKPVPSAARVRLRGSFEQRAVPVVTTYQSSQRFVNLSGSSYCKSVRDNVFSSPAPQAEPVTEGKYD